MSLNENENAILFSCSFVHSICLFFCFYRADFVLCSIFLQINNPNQIGECGQRLKERKRRKQKTTRGDAYLQYFFSPSFFLLPFLLIKNENDEWERERIFDERERERERILFQ